MASHAVSAALQLRGGKNDRRMSHLRYGQNDKPRELAAKIYTATKQRPKLPDFFGVASCPVQPTHALEYIFLKQYAI